MNTSQLPWARFCALGAALFIFFLQLHMIYVGLPYDGPNGDEPEVLLKPISMLASHSLKTDVEGYPPVVGYITLPAVAFNFFLDINQGRIKSIQDYTLTNRLLWGVHPAYLLFYSRLTTSAAGALSILLVYTIGRMLFSEEVGALSALILGAYDAYTASARIVHPNGIMGFMCLLAFYWTCQYFIKRNPRDVLLAGLFSGLAFQTKYNLWVSFVPILVCLAFESLENGFQSKNTGPLLLSITGGIFAGIVTGNPRLFESQAASENENKIFGLLFVAIFFGFAVLTRYDLWYMMIPILFYTAHSVLKNPLGTKNPWVLAALSGIGFLLGFFIGNPYIFSVKSYLGWAIANYHTYKEFNGPRYFVELLHQTVSQNARASLLLPLILPMLMTKDRKNVILLLSFPIAYYLYVGSQRYYMTGALYVAIYPFLALVAGTGLSWGIRSVAALTMPRRVRYAGWAAAAAVLCVIYPQYKSYANEMMTRPWFLRYSTFERYYRSTPMTDDARKNMTYWINRNLPGGTTIAVDKFLHLYMEDLGPQFKVIPFDHTQSSILDLYKQGVNYVLMGEYDSFQSREFYKKLDVVQRCGGLSRPLGADAGPSLNLSSLLLQLKRQDVFNCLPSPELVKSTCPLPLTSFITEFPFDSPHQFQMGYYLGAERKMMLNPGKYHLEMLEFSHLSWTGNPHVSYPLIDAKIMRMKAAFPNSNFSRGNLDNWTTEGEAFNNPPTFIIGNPASNMTKDDLFYINTDMILSQKDFMNGCPAARRPHPETTGVLRSKIFRVNASKFAFYLVGQAPEKKNYIEFTFFSKDRVLSREKVFPYEKSVFVTYDLTKHSGQAYQVAVYKQEKASMVFSGLKAIQEEPLGEKPIDEFPKTYIYDSFEIARSEEVILRIEHRTDTHPDSPYEPYIRGITLVKDSH